MRPVYVIGHKNPDTDSICSAIAYAHLRQALTGQPHEARRAGGLNSETAYVLSRFQVPAPPLLESLEPRAEDIRMSRAPGLEPEASLLQAWERMQAEGVDTLPVLHRRRLAGIVSLDDIARSYLADHERSTLSRAETPYANLVRTLGAELLTGDLTARVCRGSVAVASDRPERPARQIAPGDLVLTGGRAETQRAAIEAGADCLIVTQAAPVEEDVLCLARRTGCAVLVTPYDIYTVSRLINQAIPVRHVMRTEGLVTFDADDPVSELKTVMARRRHRYFPVLDEEGGYLGLVSRRDLLDLQPQQVVLVDHNERAQAVDGIGSAEILEIIDHHRLGNLETIQPVLFRNQPLGSTATIIAQMYQEHAVELPETVAALLLAAILSDTLLFRSPTCTQADRRAAQTLAERTGLSPEELALAMFRAGSRLSDRTPEEIFWADFKQFHYEDVDFGIGQVSSVSPEELEELGERLYPCLLRARESGKLDMVLFMLTNILDESTELLFAGAGTQALLQAAFSVRPGDHSVRLPGMLSRKKQMVPALLDAIARMGE